jgi:hypothetical protein
MSHRQDVTRGFGSYVHLTLDPHPRIVQSKLAAGFPHIRLAVDPNAIEATDFSLCRYNIAMTRYLRRENTPGFTPSSTNGRYYDNQQIPVAKTARDKDAMLQEHLSAGTMIEVLVENELYLPEETVVTCFSRPDAEIATNIFKALHAPWAVTVVTAPSPYARNDRHADHVVEFVNHALADPQWKGDGLEFDRV